MFLALSPDPKLSAFVRTYILVQDLPGKHAGQPIRTSPVPLAVLSVNIGRPNAAEDGSLVPRVSLLGLQSRARLWRSGSETCFVMVLLTIPGILRLFPGTGAGCADALLDLGALTGDTIAGSLSRDVDAANEPIKLRLQLDRWLMTRMAATAPTANAGRIAAAHDVLRWSGSVETTAQTVDTTRRQLHRWFVPHLGIGPQELADLERLHASLRSVQTGEGDPVMGFSDQAHQIRSWRRRLNVTPGLYCRTELSPMAASLMSSDAAIAAGYYL
ncbi:MULTISPECIES: hypothetical protein [unclassified Aureimonas]|uniref:hypothetical protein n=1 Tax=unclassified Aureimonas TaxID=2615206 RepID=UPI000701E7E8|nr:MULTISPECIES: hypothetical protein [unclassified Aureimonas]KQT65835.1 hypothetical protein ASG62_21305 [Aureimonas sp. Leaf427]KQT78055.1 hypothetical protein ASG54_03270 [Aureimonas sp. Leaf460]